MARTFFDRSTYSGLFLDPLNTTCTFLDETGLTGTMTFFARSTSYYLKFRVMHLIVCSSSLHIFKMIHVNAVRASIHCGHRFHEFDFILSSGDRQAQWEFRLLLFLFILPWRFFSRPALNTTCTFLDETGLTETMTFFAHSTSYYLKFSVMRLIVCSSSLHIFKMIHVNAVRASIHCGHRFHEFDFILSGGDRQAQWEF